MQDGASRRSGYGKVPARPPGQWLERQQIVERYAKEGWGIALRWRRMIAVSTGTLFSIIVATAVISGATVSMLSQMFPDGITLGLGGSVEERLLKRLLVETRADELKRVCSSMKRIGGGASGSGGWMVCLDSALGRRWKMADKHAVVEGIDKQWGSENAGRTGRGSEWAQRTPVPCRGVSIGVGIDPIFDLDLALEHDCVVDVFDIGVRLHRNDFEQAPAGFQGRVRFHPRGLSERQESVSSMHVKHLELIRSNSTAWTDPRSLHPGYNILSEGPGWALEGHSGTIGHSGADAMPVDPLHLLLERSQHAGCKHMLSAHSPGCQVDVLKIDCGECEWQAVRDLWHSASARILEEVDQLLIEVHLTADRLAEGGDAWKMIALLQSNGFDLFHTESREGRANSWPLTAVSSSHGTAIAAVKTGWVRRRGGRVAEEEEGDEAGVEGRGHALRGGVGLERIVSAEGLASAQRAPAQI